MIFFILLKSVQSLFQKIQLISLNFLVRNKLLFHCTKIMWMIVDTWKWALTPYFDNLRTNIKTCTYLLSVSRCIQVRIPISTYIIVLFGKLLFHHRKSFSSRKLVAISPYQNMWILDTWKLFWTTHFDNLRTSMIKYTEIHSCQYSNLRIFY